MAIRITLFARDTAHARAILDAVEKIEAPPVPNEILVSPDGTHAPPTGHTYRELCDARRAGLLDASMTAKGLVFTPEALDAYRSRKAARRRKHKVAPVIADDLNPHRLRALAKAGVRPKIGN